MSEAADRLAQMMREMVSKVKSNASPQSHMATVTRIEGDTTYVRIDGSQVETPVSKLVNANVGDRVSVTIQANTARITGNGTSPPTDDTIANVAKAVAEATNQHFFTDTNGIHVTEATQEDWEENHSGANVLINSLGQLFRNGLNNLVSITSSATQFYDGVANAASNVVAQFGSFGAIIGKVASSHFAQDATSATFYGTDGTTKTLSIETHNDGGKLAFNGDLSSITGVLNLLNIFANGNTRNGAGILSLYANSKDPDTATGTYGQSYLALNSDQSVANAELSSVDGNGGMASVRVDGKNSRVDVTGAMHLLTPLARSQGGTGVTDYGTVETESTDTAISMGSGSWVTICSLQLAGGAWLVTYGARYDTNATGRRYVCLNNASGNPSAGYQLATCESMNAVSGGNTFLRGAWVVSGVDTLYLKGFQNSGGNLDTYGYIRAVKLR